jgi:hypothetical protein
VQRRAHGGAGAVGEGEEGHLTKIDLDSRDLIRLEREPVALVDRLRDLLTATRSQVVLTASTIVEVSAPLVEKSGKPGVMSLLHRLETLPHTWLRTVDLEERELVAAVRSLADGTPYRAPVPYVASYLDTLVNLDPTARMLYESAPISQIIWDVAFGGGRLPSTDRYAATFEKWVEVNRVDAAAARGQRAYLRKLQHAYSRKIRNLLEPLLPSGGHMDYDRLGADLWDRPDWCPALRLSFEVVHQFFRDLGTRPTVSDMIDFTRMLSVPYVDVFTTDAAKRDYLRGLRAGKQSRLRRCSYWSSTRVAVGLDEVLELLAAAT